MLHKLTEEFEELSDDRASDLLLETRPAWIEWQPSPHQSSRRGSPITAIIYHFTAGSSLIGTVRWFQNRASQVSAHYVIGKDGRIVQMVPLEQAAWHAGRSILAGRGGVNRFSIGIEIVNWGPLSKRGGVFFTHSGQRYTGPTPVRARGRYWEPFTEAQYRALIRLTRYLLSRFPAITHITGHEDIAIPRGRKNDPGGAFDWTRLRAGLRSLFRGHIGPLTDTSALPTTGPGSRPSGAGLGSRIIQTGMRGADVKELQIRVAGWAAGSPSRTYVAVNGIFGSQTQAAVKRFQRAYGLVANGIADAQTQRALNGLESADGSTAHFAWREFYSRDGSQFSGGKVDGTTVKENIRRLMWKLEALRKKAGDRPISITSGFRSLRHNTKVGGAGNSMHMYGVAADIKVRGLNPSQVRPIARTCGFSGVKAYSSWVHVDSRIEYPYGSQFWWWPS